MMSFIWRPWVAMQEFRRSRKERIAYAVIPLGTSLTARLFPPSIHQEILDCRYRPSIWGTPLKRNRMQWGRECKESHQRAKWVGLGIFDAQLPLRLQQCGMWPHLVETKFFWCRHVDGEARERRIRSAFEHNDQNWQLLFVRRHLQKKWFPWINCTPNSNFRAMKRGSSCNTSGFVRSLGTSA